jgi:RNA polymerase sigma factor (sigma-70 family)
MDLPAAGAGRPMTFATRDLREALRGEVVYCRLTHMFQVPPAKRVIVEGAATLEPSLLTQLQQRDPCAQASFYRVNRGALLALARATLSCPADAPALVADVFTDFFYRYVDFIRDERSVASYLRVMIVRRSRRQNLSGARIDNLDENMADPSQPDLVQSADCTRWTVWLDDCLATLADRARRLVRLHYGHELSLSQIGSQMGVSKQAVGKIVQKSLELLRCCLEDKRGRGRAEGHA